MTLQLPDQESVQQVLRRVYREQGYLIVGQPPDVGAKKLKLGDVIEKILGFDLGARFIVVSAAMRDDWVSQADLIERLMPAWTRQNDPYGGWFFRVELNNKMRLVKPRKKSAR